MKYRVVKQKAVATGTALSRRYNEASLSACEYLLKNSNTLLGVFGVILLVGGLHELSVAQGDYGAGVTAAGGGFGVGGNPTQACSRVLGYIEGGFGALVATGAGLGAIVAAALGGFKAAWCLLVVSIGCFILRSYLTLFHAGCRAA